MNKQLFKIGDIVTIRDTGLSYETYKAWFTETGNEELVSNYRPCPLYATGTEGIIVASGSHSWYPERTLYAVQLTGMQIIYLIEEEGLELKSKIISCNISVKPSDVSPKGVKYCLYTLETTVCTHYTDCPLYTSNQCICKANRECPYGTKIIKQDKTIDSSNLVRKYIDIEKSATNTLSDLKPFKGPFVAIGSYYILNIPYVTVWQRKSDHSYFISPKTDSWIGRSEEADNFEMVNSQVIDRTYLDDESEFIKTLLSFETKVNSDAPMLINYIIKYAPELARKLNVFVGQKAKLNTLNYPIICTVDNGITRILWDGTCASILDIKELADKYPYLKNLKSGADIRVLVNDNCYVTIEDNSWVNDKTIFER